MAKEPEQILEDLNNLIDQTKKFVKEFKKTGTLKGDLTEVIYAHKYVLLYSKLLAGKGVVDAFYIKEGWRKRNVIKEMQKLLKSNQICAIYQSTSAAFVLSVMFSELLPLLFENACTLATIRHGYKDLAIKVYNLCTGYVTILQDIAIFCNRGFEQVEDLNRNIAKIKKNLDKIKRRYD